MSILRELMNAPLTSDSDAVLHEIRNGRMRREMAHLCRDRHKYPSRLFVTSIHALEAAPRTASRQVSVAGVTWTLHHGYEQHSMHNVGVLPLRLVETQTTFENVRITYYCSSILNLETGDQNKRNQQNRSSVQATPPTTRRQSATMQSYQALKDD